MDEMNELVNSLFLETASSLDTYYIGIFFDLEDPQTKEPPQNLKYFLRMQKYWFTDLVFSSLQIPGPRTIEGV